MFFDLRVLKTFAVNVKHREQGHVPYMWVTTCNLVTKILQCFMDLALLFVFHLS
jgi:hypothetical protein